MMQFVKLELFVSNGLFKSMRYNFIVIFPTHSSHKNFSIIFFENSSQFFIPRKKVTELFSNNVDTELLRRKSN